jgi:prepilin-type N-terminal cleavage/methylation domain-containing protein
MMRRFAFSLLELVFVLIVIGILAVLAMPNFNGHPLQTAAEQVAGHIRYTQHLAIMDDKYDPTDPTWWEKRWQIRFPHTLINGVNVYYYEVFRDENKAGNSNLNEEAVDPLTHETIGDGLDAVAAIPDKSLVNLTKRYGITTVTGTCVIGGAFHTLAFDSIGRPYLDVYTGLFSHQVPAAGCTLLLTHPTDGTATITIHSQTGYVSVTYP